MEYGTHKGRLKMHQTVVQTVTEVIETEEVVPPPSNPEAAAAATVRREERYGADGQAIVTWSTPAGRSTSTVTHRETTVGQAKGSAPCDASCRSLRRTQISVLVLSGQPPKGAP